MSKIIYLDNNATTKPAPEVVEAMFPFLTKMWGNPSSLHTFGGQVAAYIETARSQVAKLLNCQNPKEIVFTSCGTESNNTAIFSALKTHPNKKHIITTRVEHPAVLNVAKALEKSGYRVTYLSVNEPGHLNLDELRDAIKDDTALVSVMWANNETGVIFPIDKIAKICAERGVLFHTDAVQAAGKISMSLKDIPINFLSISGHKLHAPKGVGALYIKSGTPFHPYLIGGHHERSRRAGTENVASIVGLGKACEFVMKNMDKETSHVKKLRDRLEKGIIENVAHAHVNGDREMRLPNTTNISFDGIEGEAIILLLNESGICLSSGSACSSDSLEPSHVLTAMGLPDKRKHSSIRFSLSIYNDEKEIDFTISKVEEVVKRLRDLSPIPF
ncbi:MAG: cysteine desulfurase NifS [Pseudomonadota bacterium]